MAPDLKASSSPPASDLVAACADAHVGAHRDVHADEAGGAGEHRADRKADGDQPAEREAEDDEDDDADNADGGVLALEIGLRAFAHGGGNLLHLGAAGIGAQHRTGRPDAIEDREHATADDHPQSVHGGLNLDLKWLAEETLPPGARSVEDGRFEGASPRPESARI